jgi:thiol-disulfide isomerase/thioredoxin
VRCEGFGKTWRVPSRFTNLGKCRMFRPPFAILLSLWLVFSLPTAGLCATAGAGQALVPLQAPIALPSVLLQTTAERETTLADVMKEGGKDHYYLLHLWAPKCRACIPEMEQLDKIQGSLAKQGFVLLAVAQDSNGSFTVPAFAKRYDIKTIDSYIDKQAALLNKLQPAGLPTTYLVTPDGLVIASHEGSMDWQAMASAAP